MRKLSNTLKKSGRKKSIKPPKKIENEKVAENKDDTCKVKVESVGIIMEQVRKLVGDGKKDRDLLEKMESILEKRTEKTDKTVSPKKVDKMNEKYLDLCFTRRDTLEKYRNYYMENVVQKIKENVLYKHVGAERGYDGYKMNYSGREHGGLADKMEQMPKMLSSLKKVEGMLKEEKVSVEVDEMRRIRSYFRGL
ncbi:hypothetical protein ECANGB1_877 [Enterospora canceri]|uniref:Uncharacterized protein n=1 Tax=Enterospora canceri TaxID=1081671 RepID=A0A1Y1S829_9MICR|nr:hypothetical protein ECANGB1_877 [Enterospora canceri]